MTVLSFNNITCGVFFPFLQRKKDHLVKNLFWRCCTYQSHLIRYGENRIQDPATQIQQLGTWVNFMNLNEIAQQLKVFERPEAESVDP